MRIALDTNEGAREFHSLPGEKLLRAALRHGIDLPYDCATGTCGSCKVQLVAGRAVTDWPEAPAAGRCKPGQVLTCQAIAVDDCTLRVDRLRCPPPGAERPASLSGTLAHRSRLAAEILSFEIQIEAPLAFGPGQFMLIEAAPVPGARAYSIAGRTGAGGRLKFIARRKAGGRLTEWLFDSANTSGAPVKLFGPLGRAVFDGSIGKDLLCVGGGSGIAGMLAIVGRAADQGYFDRFRAGIFFGVRTASDLFALDELARLCRRNPGRVTATVAVAEGPMPEALAGAHAPVSFEPGMIHEVLDRGVAAGPLRRAFLAGPTPMVDAVLRLLLRKGLPPGEILFDRFH